MRKLLALLLLLFLTGCAPAGEKPAPAPEAPPAVETPAPQGEAVVAPAPKQPEPLTFGLGASPDGKWEAYVQHSALSIQEELWVRPSGGANPVRIADKLTGNTNLAYHWTPDSQLLYYREAEDTWFAADPATGESRLYFPQYLPGRAAGNLAFSPDGSRLLYRTNICYYCNQPGRFTETDYVIDLKTGVRTEVGVNLELKWEGNELVKVPQGASLVYHPYWARSAAPLTFELPAQLWCQLVGADYAEWRIYPEGSARPLTVIPAAGVSRNAGELPGGLWGEPDFPTITLPDLPDGRVELQLWAQVKPDAVLNPGIEPPVRDEAGRYWTQVFRALGQGKGKAALPLSHIEMATPQDGWALHANGPLLRTTDGGATWQDVTPAALASTFGRAYVRKATAFGDGARAGVAFSDWRVGADHRWTDSITKVTVARTADGGRTWQASGPVETGIRFAVPVSLSLVDASTAYLMVSPGDVQQSREGALFATVDGGRTWSKVGDTAGSLPSGGAIRFISRKTGFLLGPDGQLWQTADGGQSWKTAGGGVRPAVVGHLPQFITPTTGFLPVSQPSGTTEVYRTDDGGTSWSLAFSVQGYVEPVFVGEREAWIWDYDGRHIRWTHDGGQTWEQIPWPENPSSVRQFFFTSPQNGWAIIDGRLRHSTDGGRTWTDMNAKLAGG